MPDLAIENSSPVAPAVVEAPKPIVQAPVQRAEAPIQRVETPIKEEKKQTETEAIDVI